MLIAELAARHREDDGANSYGPQVIMLKPPGEGDFFIRANIWPSEDEHTMRASGGGAFVYSLPHDHNFSFLTLGYFGPGYWSNYYEFDYEKSPVGAASRSALRFVERSRLEEGKIQLYRAHRDVHEQEPAECALGLDKHHAQSPAAQGWLDQYSFDVENASYRPDRQQWLERGISCGSPSGWATRRRGTWPGDSARRHPSDSLRLAAWTALASVETGAEAREGVWQAAESSGSLLVTQEAQMRRRELAS